ncbi:ATP-dependent DNA ligase [Candidatus Curtissbacteria bacterium]|nr:ATP-dependent DNA ligase [Candidatus Curtissbacteria bacterium]
MKFSKLAEYYEKLEATSKRLELVDILSKLFKESDTSEIGKICYLIQGRVAPFFEPIELGMAESMVAQAVGRAYGHSKDEVIKHYRSKGNMGLTAQQLVLKSHLRGVIRKNRDHFEGGLSVSAVFDELLKIAKFSGAGTVEQKVSTLANLLKKLDPVSVKHVVNIPLGTLRLGIGDPTVMDALSLAKTGGKKLRPVIEDAYNKTSDLGFVAEVFFKKGQKGLSEIKLMVGKPVRPALAERMPNAEEVVKRMGDKFAAEPKFDGFRVQVHKNGDKVEIFSRNLEDMTHSFPDLAEGVLGEVKAKTAIMEGEAIAYNPETEEFLPFQETTKRRRKYKIAETAKALPLVMFAFDILYLNGKDITEETEIVRRKLLEKVVPKGNATIRIAEQRIISTAREISEFFNEAVSDGLEGLMIKKLDSPYKAGGRGFHWIKFKRASSGDLADTVDCVLLGVYAGKGKRTVFGVGGLLVGVYDEKNDSFVTICRLGTGLTDEEFKQVHEIAQKLKVSHQPARVNSKIEPSYWVEPKVVLEVYADEITKSPIHTAGEADGVGFALRFPRLVKFRESEKRPEDSTTVSEIKKLYELQFKRK